MATLFTCMYSVLRFVTSAGDTNIGYQWFALYLLLFFWIFYISKINRDLVVTLKRELFLNYFKQKKKKKSVLWGSLINVLPVT